MDMTMGVPQIRQNESCQAVAAVKDDEPILASPEVEAHREQFARRPKTRGE